MNRIAQGERDVKPPPAVLAAVVIPTVEEMATQFEAPIRAFNRVVFEFHRVDWDLHTETPSAVLGKLSLLAGRDLGFDPKHADERLRLLAAPLDDVAAAAARAESMGPAGRAAWTLARERVMGGVR